MKSKKTLPPKYKPLSFNPFISQLIYELIEQSLRANRIYSTAALSLWIFKYVSFQFIDIGPNPN